MYAIFYIEEESDGYTTYKLLAIAFNLSTLKDYSKTAEIPNFIPDRYQHNHAYILSTREDLEKMYIFRDSIPFDFLIEKINPIDPAGITQ